MVEEEGRLRKEEKNKKIIARLNFEIAKKFSLSESLLHYMNRFYTFMFILLISI